MKTKIHIQVGDKAGTIEVIGYEAPWRREIFSWDDEPEQRFFEKAMTDDPHDVSKHHSIYLGYHPKCSCCWLNIPHTENYHRASLENEDR